MSLDNARKFTLSGTYEAKCIKVYDGDTAHFAFKVFGDYYKFKCRMAGYNSAELKSKDPVEKEAGTAARDFLSNLICGKMVKLEVGDFDKYGRLLVNVWLDNVHVNSLMIQDHGKKYNGHDEKEW